MKRPSPAPVREVKRRVPAGQAKVKERIDVALVARGLCDIPRQGQLAKRQLQIFKTAAVAAHVLEKEIIDVNVLPAIEPASCPKLESWLAGDDVAD